MTILMQGTTISDLFVKRFLSSFLRLELIELEIIMGSMLDKYTGDNGKETLGI